MTICILSYNPNTVRTEMLGFFFFSFQFPIFFQKRSNGIIFQNLWICLPIPHPNYPHAFANQSPVTLQPTLNLTFWGYFFPYFLSIGVRCGEGQVCLITNIYGWRLNSRDVHPSQNKILPLLGYQRLVATRSTHLSMWQTKVCKRS